MKTFVRQLLTFGFIAVLMLACTKKPREGLYYCAGNILEVVWLKHNRIAFQIISKRNRQTQYISGKAKLYKDNLYVSTELFGNHHTNRLFFECKPGQIQITENSLNPSQKFFEGIYDFFSADKLRSEAIYFWNTAHLQPKL
ncbi:MAG: hypothetical protein RMJ87_01795 [Cytophagales bacterium]|nr:hypothetical protein [Bernardetiaceae bacterium]MDW8203735.1 hypothetical protein [Cytophagales bacterium]